jgi:hypothetical protein
MVLVMIGLAACGRIGFETCPETCGTIEPGSACTDDRDCATGHCADGVCCDSACAGSCDSCASGTCVADPSACTGDCASCVVADGGFSCAPVPAACVGACGAGTCSGAGARFVCSFGTCCSTAVAPNIAGSCSTGPAVVLADGCSFEYDYSSWTMASNFVELDWDVEQCQQGTWVSIDSGADAVPCTGCTHDTRNTWSDTCGNTTMRQNVCP